MPSIYRISRIGQELIVDVHAVEAIEPAIRSTERGIYHVDGISANPLPSGQTSRHGSVEIKHLDGTIALEPDPWPASRKGLLSCRSLCVPIIVIH
jgi:hypothetical protein